MDHLPFDLRTLDFAGGTVVHICAAATGLALAVYAGRRSSRNLQRPHSIPMAFIGCFLLWFGWFGFNGGSGLAADGTAINAIVVSQIAAVFGTAVLSIVPSINFSGFLFPVSSLEPAQQILGRTFPGCWFQLISLGTFTKGLSAASFVQAYGALLIEIFAYLLLASLLLKKQER